MSSVLVVDDDQMFAKAVGRDLGEQGFAVTIVHTVATALSALAESSFDVLLTDLQLGTEDGIDLLASLHDVAPRTRAVLMSGFATARDYQRAIELGAVRVLCKPFTPTELNQCIRQAVECETGFRGSVHGLSLIDMLQMFNYARRSVIITVAGQTTGRLLLREGQIVHAEHQARTGEPAVASLLAMSGGTISTSALSDLTTPSVTRDFREVLLDALRSIDESAPTTASTDDLGLALDQLVAEVEDVPVVGMHEQLLERVRQIDGYISACLVLSKSGGVIGHHGEIDLRPAANSSAEALRCEVQTLSDLGLDDEPEDVLVTLANQYHLFSTLHSDVPSFVYVVLDRTRANPAMAKRALASAMRSLDL